MTTAIQFQMSFPVDDDLAPLLQDLFFQKGLPARFEKIHEQHWCFQYDHSCQNDTRHTLTVCRMHGGPCMVTFGIQYPDDVQLVHPDMVEHMARWVVTPNYLSFWKYQEQLDVTMTHTA